MKEIYDFLKDCGTYFLGTIDEEGKPRVRPFGTIDLFEDKLYIQTGKVKDVSKQIAANPVVEICALKDGKWLRLSGTLENDDRIEAKKHMLEQYPDLQSMYSPEDDNTQVLFFKDGTATFSSFTEEPRTINF